MSARIALTRRAPRMRSSSNIWRNSSICKPRRSPAAARVMSFLRPLSGRLTPGLVPVAAEEIGDAAVTLEELVRRLEDGEEEAALRSGPGFVAAARRAPDELA